MNQYFVDKVRAIRDSLRDFPANLMQCFNTMRNKTCSAELRHVSLKTVSEMLKNLKNSRSTAVDGLDNFAVKLSADYIAKPLHHIITLSIMQNKFPSSWKYSKLIPLHKKECKLAPKNYRPVAILSPLSKILEKVVYQQVYEYFTENKFFHPNLTWVQEEQIHANCSPPDV